MKIKILLDHVSREIDFAISIKKTIEGNNLGEVVIYHQDYIASSNSYDFFEKTFDGLYDVIIIPSYHVIRTPEMLLRAVVNRAKIIVYHSEQIIREYIEPEKLNLDYTEQFNAHIAAHFVWGEDYSSKLINKAKVSPEKIFIVGNYKMDFANKCSSIVQKTVLVASDYKPADMSELDMDNFYKEYRIHFDRNRGYTCDKARKCMLNFVKEQADLFPSLTFLLRPHPGESKLEYEKILSNNVKLSEAGSTFSTDLENSDVVLGFTSTSCLEVISAKKRFISVDFFDFDKEDLSAHKILLDWTSMEKTREILHSLSEGILPVSNLGQQKKLNFLLKTYEDVGSNLISALIYINSESYEYQTKLTKYDILPLTKSFTAGVCKFLSLKMAVSLRGRLWSKLILDKVEKSYAKRISANEDFNDEILQKYQIKFPPYNYVESNCIIHTALGNIFESESIKIDKVIDVLPKRESEIDKAKKIKLV
jgi:surface carbohydrate biosynthesis protein